MMTANERARWEGALAAKLRIIEDCLSRALDQLQEPIANCPGWQYVEKQVNIAHDAVKQAQGLTESLGIGRLA